MCAAIKAKLQAVAGIGTVHDYERYTKEAARLLALYESSAQGGNRIYGWFVAERQVRERYLDIGRAIIDTVWDLVSYMTLDDGDASEKLLRVQVDKVRDAFRNDDSLGGAVDTLILDEGGGAPIRGVQLDAMDKVLFAGALCHRARCSLVTRNYVTYQ